MKRFLITFLAPILTFSIGIGIYRISTPQLTLETISEHSTFYDGMNVEIESYVQLMDAEEPIWFLGEPFEKREFLAWMEFENPDIKFENLQDQLKVGLSKKRFKRAKVLVKGKIKDNCTGEISCCFGRSLTIKVQEMKQLAPVEDFIMPK